jgi:hypothetical protein
MINHNNESEKDRVENVTTLVTIRKRTRISWYFEIKISREQIENYNTQTLSIQYTPTCKAAA